MNAGRAAGTDASSKNCVDHTVYIAVMSGAQPVACHHLGHSELSIAEA
jgi:hypothetical protein